MYNKQEYLGHLNEVGCFYSKITVSGGELLTLTDETLYNTAGCINSKAELSQANAPKSADSTQAICNTEARPGQLRGASTASQTNRVTGH